MVARMQVLIAFACGAVVAGLVGLYLPWRFWPLVGWDTTVLVYVVWTWVVSWRLDAEHTARLAVREDPTRLAADSLLVGAAVASLLAVGFDIAHAAHTASAERALLIGLGVVSVGLSWVLVHVVYTVKYVALYYAGPDGGVDFHQEEPPQFSDFAYLAFTIGMTFQVSDTSLQTSEMRRTALRQAVLAFAFAVTVIALVVNLVAGLTQQPIA